MWRMIRIASVCVILLSGAAGTDAALQFYPLSETSEVCHSSRVAAGAKAVAAWVEGDSGVLTRTWTPDGLLPIVDHGLGIQPDVASAEGNFTLAWVRDGVIHLRSGDGNSWSDMEVYDLGLPLHLPRLTGWYASTWVHGVYLCFQDDAGTVYLAERDQGAWQPAEPAMSGFSSPGIHFAQAVPLPEGTLRQPRVYAMDGEELLYADRTAEGWTTPVAVHPGEALYGVEFAAAVGPDGSQHLLSNGPQATCPCNVMTYTEGTVTGAWSWPLLLSEDFDAYTWPQDPAIAVDAAGRVHAFWFQQHYDSNLEPSWKGLYYKLLDGGVWENLSEPLCCQRGEDADLDLRFSYSPVMVWTQDWEGPHEVWLALDPDVTAAPSAPAATLALSAQPNPFNPKTTFRFGLVAPATARLAIYDVSGRHLRTLIEEGLPAGDHRLDWDGCDEAGQPLASGLYLARLTANRQRAHASVVLIR